MDTLQLIIWIILSMCGGILPASAARRFLPAPKRKFRAAVPCLVTGIALSMPTWIGDGNPLYLFPFFLAAFLTGYGGSRFARLIVGLIFYEWIIAWSMIVDTRAVLPGADGYWGAMAWKLVMWLAVFLLVRHLLPDGNHVSLSGRLWALIGLLSLAPLLSELAFSLWDIRFYTAQGIDRVLDAAFYTLLPFQFISAVALLGAVVLLSRQQALEQAQQLANMRELYYQGVQREQAQVRRLRHDLRNHLTVLSGLLSQGDAGHAADYVHALLADEGVAAGTRWCENDTVNVVLAAKARDAAAAGLELSLECTLPVSLSVSDTDLCALFGNALDNAIEAARDADDKHISVRARADKGMLMLRVINAYAGVRTPHSDGGFHTTKSDHALHGFGLRGMREIANRYGGTLEANAQGGTFELIACLPLQSTAH